MLHYDEVVDGFKTLIRELWDANARPSLRPKLVMLVSANAYHGAGLFAHLPGYSGISKHSIVDDEERVWMLFPLIPRVEYEFLDKAPRALRSRMSAGSPSFDRDRVPVVVCGEQASEAYVIEAGCVRPDHTYRDRVRAPEPEPRVPEEL